jgi:E3 ubiquitin-protein ligase RNF13
MDVTLANFGYVPYGKNLIGNVHLAEPIEACGPLKPMNVSLGNDPSPILLVKRGGCTFVSKAHYAQLIGAKLVMIVDTIEE